MIRILLSTRLGERRMTQSELARVTGIRSQTINELYHDFAERVNLDDLDLICEALDCNLDDLIVREPNPERRVKEVRHIPQTVSKSRKKQPPSPARMHVMRPGFFALSDAVYFCFFEQNEILSLENFCPSRFRL